MSLPAQSTTPNGGKHDPTFKYDANAKSFPTREELPQIDGQPPGAAWFWGADDYLGRLNLLTPARVKAASSYIKTGTVVPLNLPLGVPAWPAFGREPFEHEIKILAPDVAYDDKYRLNTQSGTQLDGFRHFAHLPSKTFYNNTKGVDIHGPNSNLKCSIHHWAEHGMAGRGILLDYWTYAKSQSSSDSDPYDPWTQHSIPLSELVACGKAQGLDIRPASLGGDMQPGDILMIRAGWAHAYATRNDAERKAAGLRPHGLGPDDGQRWAGVSQDSDMVEWLHDCYFSVVGGDAPSFEAWPSSQGHYLHEYLLACWGVPIGEMWDLEELARVCRREGRWVFFFNAAPANVKGGVSSHLNGTAVL